MQKSDFHKRLHKDTQVVDSMPTWKQRSLDNSFKAKNHSPRTVVKSTIGEKQSSKVTT